MKAMILCAGRGERMRPLTDTRPKPLLAAGGKSLLAYHIENLVAAGIKDLVINHAYLGQQIEASIGDGQSFGARIRYSPETQALETGGGICNALPLLGEEPFVVVNGDIWTDYPMAGLTNKAPHLAHLVLVNNPSFHSQGDFCFDAARGKLVVCATDTDRLTFSGISVLSPRLFAGKKIERFPLAPLIREHIAAGAIGAEHYQGFWSDVGTPQRLASLQEKLHERFAGK